MGPCMSVCARADVRACLRAVRALVCGVSLSLSLSLSLPLPLPIFLGLAITNTFAFDLSC